MTALRSKEIEAELDASAVSFDLSLPVHLSLRRAKQLWSMAEAYQREPALEPQFRALHKYLRFYRDLAPCFEHAGPEDKPLLDSLFLHASAAEKEIERLRARIDAGEEQLSPSSMRAPGAGLGPSPSAEASAAADAAAALAVLGIAAPAASRETLARHSLLSAAGASSAATQSLLTQALEGAAARAAAASASVSAPPPPPPAAGGYGGWRPGEPQSVPPGPPQAAGPPTRVRHRVIAHHERGKGIVLPPSAAAAAQPQQYAPQQQQQQGPLPPPPPPPPQDVGAQWRRPEPAAAAVASAAAPSAPPLDLIDHPSAPAAYGYAQPSAPPPPPPPPVAAQQQQYPDPQQQQAALALLQQQQLQQQQQQQAAAAAQQQAAAAQQQAAIQLALQQQLSTYQDQQRRMSGLGASSAPMAGAPMVPQQQQYAQHPQYPQQQYAQQQMQVLSQAQQQQQAQLQAVYQQRYGVAPGQAPQWTIPLGPQAVQVQQLQRPSTAPAQPCCPPAPPFSLPGAGGSTRGLPGGYPQLAGPPPAAAAYYPGAYPGAAAPAYGPPPPPPPPASNGALWAANGTRVGAPWGGGKTSIRLSPRLLDDFGRLAEFNTRRNVETCAVLAGCLTQGTFLVTHCLLPKQSGTSDSCTATNEEELFDVCDSRGIITLGWVHTHPRQTCFLSSVDLHTHCGYQSMLEEAVAVVLAPTDPSKRVGFFQLTQPEGVRLIQRCKQQGFHPHDDTPSGNPLYTDAGHVQLDERVGFQVLDLR